MSARPAVGPGLRRDDDAAGLRSALLLSRIASTSPAALFATSQPRHGGEGRHPRQAMSSQPIVGPGLRRDDDAAGRAFSAFAFAHCINIASRIIRNASTTSWRRSRDDARTDRHSALSLSRIASASEALSAMLHSLPPPLPPGPPRLLPGPLRPRLSATKIMRPHVPVRRLVHAR